MHRSAWIDGLGHAVGSQYCAPSHLPTPAVEHCVQSAWHATTAHWLVYKLPLFTRHKLIHIMQTNRNNKCIMLYANHSTLDSWRIVLQLYQHLQMHRLALIEGLGHAVGSQYSAASHFPTPAVEHRVQPAWQAKIQKQQFVYNLKCW